MSKQQFAPIDLTARPSIGQMIAKNRGMLLAFVIFVGGLVAISFSGSSSLQSMAIYAMIYALPAIGLNLLMGLAGQVSLGQAAFFAIGAYTFAILTTRYNVPDALAGLAGIALAMLLAFLVGLPILRLRGHYLALATLGLGFVVSILLRESEFAGSNTGIFGIAKPEILGEKINKPFEFLLYLLPFVLIALIMSVNLVRSRIGRSLSAINDSELASEVLGVRTFTSRLGVFVIAGGLAGLGGIFYAYQVGLVSPTIADFHLSVQFLLMAVIGGLGSVWGAIAGAFFVQWLTDGLRDVIQLVIPGASGQVELLGFGIILVLFVILLPGGLYGAFVGVLNRVKQLIGRKERAAAAVASAESEADLEDAELIIPDVSTPVARGETILEVRDLTKRYGGVVAVDNVSFDITAGKIVGLIGPNGAGKTTCFNMMTGVLTPTTGTVTYLGETVSGKRPSFAALRGLTRTFQNLQVLTSTTVLGNVYMGRYRLGKAGFVRGMLGFQGKEQRENEQRALEILATMNLADAATTMAGDLPFGRQRMMEVTRALASEPAILLLDEPMAGLSGRERNRLASLMRGLRDAGLTIVIVEHDVSQVMALADQVIVLDDGALIANGTPDEVQNNPAVIAAYLGTDDVDAVEHELEEL